MRYPRGGILNPEDRETAVLVRSSFAPPSQLSPPPSKRKDGEKGWQRPAIRRPLRSAPSSDLLRAISRHRWPYLSSFSKFKCVCPSAACAREEARPAGFLHPFARENLIGGKQCDDAHAAPHAPHPTPTLTKGPKALSTSLLFQKVSTSTAGRTVLEPRYMYPRF